MNLISALVFSVLSMNAYSAEIISLSGTYKNDRTSEVQKMRIMEKNSNFFLMGLSKDGMNVFNCDGKVHGPVQKPQAIAPNQYYECSKTDNGFVHQTIIYTSKDKTSIKSLSGNILTIQENEDVIVDYQDFNAAGEVTREGSMFWIKTGKF